MVAFNGKRVGVMVLLCFYGSGCLAARSGSQLQDLYKTMGEELGSIKKEYAAAQPKIYSLLDQIDKMYNIAKTSAQKRKNLKKTLTTKLSELSKARQEVANLKKELASTKQKYETEHKQFETEKNHMLAFTKEHNDLTNRINKLENQQNEVYQKKATESKLPDLNLKDTELQERALKELQSLTLSSTSAPNSLR